MRWATVLTIAVLLAGVPCLPACALAAWTPQVPPCHQHHKAPAQTGDFCDHQNAVKDAAASPLPTQPVLAIFDAVRPPEMTASTAVSVTGTVTESVPPLGRLAVLRI
jgi:hypothetical protein